MKTSESVAFLLLLGATLVTSSPTDVSNPLAVLQQQAQIMFAGSKEELAGICEESKEVTRTLMKKAKAKGASSDEVIMMRATNMACDKVENDEFVLKQASLDELFDIVRGFLAVDRIVDVDLAAKAFKAIIEQTTELQRMAKTDYIAEVTSFQSTRMLETCPTDVPK